MFGLTVLFAIAGALTSLWLGVIGFYVSHGSGWGNLLTLPPSDLAVFVLAALGPIAGLWLVAGYLLQGLQSRRLMIALRLMASQNRRSAEALEVQGATLRDIVTGGSGGGRDNSSAVAAVELAIRDLNGQMALLAERLGVFDQDEAETLWRRTQAGDLWGIAYAFLTRANIYPEFPHLLAERLAADPMAGDGLAGILRTGEGLIAQVADAGTPPLVTRIVEGGPIGRLLALFRHVDHLAGSYSGQVETGHAETVMDAGAPHHPAEPEPFVGIPAGAAHPPVRRETLGAQLVREGTAPDAADPAPAAVPTVPKDIANAIRRAVEAATEAQQPSTDHTVAASHAAIGPEAEIAAAIAAPVAAAALLEAEQPVLGDIIRGSHPDAGMFEIVDPDLNGRDGDDLARVAAEAEAEAAPHTTETRPSGDLIENSLNRLQEALRRMNEGDFASIADSDDSVGRHGDRAGNGIDPMPAPTMVLGAAPARPQAESKTEAVASVIAAEDTAATGEDALRPMAMPENPRYSNKKPEPAGAADPTAVEPHHDEKNPDGTRQPDFWTGTEWIVPPSSSTP